MHTTKYQGMISSIHSYVNILWGYLMITSLFLSEIDRERERKKQKENKIKNIQSLGLILF